MSGRALIQLSKLAGRSAKAAASGQMGGQAEALQTVRDMAVVLPQRLEKSVRLSPPSMCSRKSLTSRRLAETILTDNLAPAISTAAVHQGFCSGVCSTASVGRRSRVSANRTNFFFPFSPILLFLCIVGVGTALIR